MKHLVLILVVLAFCLVSCGENSPTATSKPDNSTAVSKTPTTIPTPTIEPHSVVGDTVLRDGFEITLVSATILDPATIPQHEQVLPSITPDQTFLVLSEKLKNTTAGDLSFAGATLVLSDEAGHRDFGVQIGLPNMPDGVGGVITPGMLQLGSSAYVVPKTTHLFYLTYYAKVGTSVVWEIHV